MRAATGRAPGQRQDDAPGADSFLDIVANLVGILIILVMVIGVRAKDALVEAAGRAATQRVPEAAVEDEIPDAHVHAAGAAAKSLESDINRIDRNIKRVGQEIALREQQRDRLGAALIAAQQELAKRRQILSAARQEKYDLSRALADLQAELSSLQDERESMLAHPPEPGIIEHLPTPMAKTVFGLEEHFRLFRGRLAYVPLGELVERLKTEARQKTWKLREADRITETLGPLRGFRMKYTLKKENVAVALQAGAQIRQRIELDHFVLVPVADNLGEPFEKALESSSQFHRLVEGLDPQRTTITVWVYPDSFEQFRILKQHLFQRGFVTAGRPLPAGSPIGGSPDGSRSASQ